MKTLILMLASMLVTGCAIAPDTGEPREQKAYRTGSNIQPHEMNSLLRT